MKKLKKKITWYNVVFDILIVLVFIFGAVCLIQSFFGETFYIFGTRFDVVLSESMSKKNENHLDFLEGHDDQVQAFDLVVSKKVTKQEDVKLYDIVIFENPYIGQDMHRIVGISLDRSDKINLKESTVVTYQNENFISLPNLTSGLETNRISFNEVTMEYYSPREYKNDINFNINSSSYTPKIESKFDSSFGMYDIKLTRTKSSKAPGILYISHAQDFDYSKDLIKKISINSGYGLIEVLPQDFEKSEVKNQEKEYNISLKYEIRGDAAKGSDGYYSINQIYSKVFKVIPKLGFPIRFMTSIWGIVLIIVIILVLALSDFLIAREDEYEKKRKYESYYDDLYVQGLSDEIVYYDPKNPKKEQKIEEVKEEQTNKKERKITFKKLKHSSSKIYFLLRKKGGK